jgi:GNAT superfamily N-acetyltransferase
MTSRLGWYATLLFSHKRVYFQEYPDLRSIREPPPDRSITISQLTESDFADFLAMNKRYNQGTFRSPADLTAALEMGHRCYIARRGPELLGFLWIAVREVTSPDLKCRFLLEPDQIVSYHHFVRPDSRGRNLATRLQAVAYRKAAKDGFRRCYSYVLSSNEPSIRSMRKAFARRVGQLDCGYALGYYFFRMRTVRDFTVTAEVTGGRWFAWKRFLAKRGLGRILGRPC